MVPSTMMKPSTAGTTICPAAENRELSIEACSVTVVPSLARIAALHRRANRSASTSGFIAGPVFTATLRSVAPSCRPYFSGMIPTS